MSICHRFIVFSELCKTFVLYITILCVLQPEVSVRVVAIKFELEPPRVAVLKLARTDWESGELMKNEYFYVKYHDVNHVVDFLILRQMYDKSTRRNWNEGDR